jgi:hypothetical protein
MDSFAWVNDLSDRLEAEGQQRLAYLIHDVPHQQYQGNHALVEALVPEALAAARGLDIPWLDVYFKHWLCASRVARHHGEVQLGEVVSAYEGAHQDKTQGCPQSVCVTQDLVATYANVDGPGWAAERLAACDETLARIDPSWGCFGCLSIERANALGDQGQPREAVLYLTRQRDAQRRAGEEVNTLFVTTEVEHWLAAGEPRTALKLLDDSQDDADEDDRREQSARLLQRCRALAMAGEPQAGWDLLPAFEDIEVADYVSWCRAAVIAARALPALNTPALGHALWTTVEHLHTVGSHRLLIDLAIAQGELALARQVPWLAGQAVARAHHHVPLLREDLGAGAEVRKAGQALAAAPVPAAPRSPEELPGWLRSPEAEGLSNEIVIQWLEQAHQALPEDEGLAMMLASALAGYGCHELARTRLQAMVLAAPQSVPLQNHWFGLCLDAGDLAAIEEQARRIEAAQPAMAAWYRARVAFKEARYAQVGPLVEQVLANDPEATPTRRLWADAAMQLKDFDTAVAQRRAVLAADESPAPAHRWELLIAATAAQAWSEVRAQALALEMQLEPGQPEGNAGASASTSTSVVEEDWGLVYLRCEENGRTRDVLARRTGPATARIVQPSPRALAQRLGDWVVFEPKLAEQPPEDEEELRHYTRVFTEPVHVLEKGGHGPSYMIDGVHPGEERVSALRDALGEEGWSTWQYSNDSYRVTDPDASDEDGGDPSDEEDEDDQDDQDDEDGLPGLYLAVTAPADVPPRVIAARVAALCKGLQLCWTDLARAAGEPTEWHEAMQARYDL